MTFAAIINLSIHCPYLTQIRHSSLWAAGLEFQGAKRWSGAVKRNWVVCEPFLGR
jgi:hypothetical protein